MSVLNACSQIRNDAGKGKKCPGGYSIPQKHKCGGADRKNSRPAERSGARYATGSKEDILAAAALISIAAIGLAAADAVSTEMARIKREKEEKRSGRRSEKVHISIDQLEEIEENQKKATETWQQVAGVLEEIEKEAEILRKMSGGVAPPKELPKKQDSKESIYTDSAGSRSGNASSRGRGKKCPGGYAIPQGKKCRGQKPKAASSKKPEAVSKEGILLGGAVLGGTVLASVGALVVAMKHSHRKTIAATEFGKEVDRLREEKASVSTNPSATPEDRAAAAESYKEAKKEFQERFGYDKNKVEDLLESTAQSRREAEEILQRAKDGLEKIRAAQERGLPSKETTEEVSLREELGLSQNPTKEELARARRTAAKKYHPDVGGGDKEKMAGANAALDRMEKRIRIDSLSDRFNNHYEEKSAMNSFDACAQIRDDAIPTKGKKCPGGYWIPRTKKCNTLSSPGSTPETKMAAKVQRKRGKTGETHNANRWRLAGAVALGGLAMHQSDQIKKEKERRKKEIEDQAKKKVERTRREAERRANAESRAGGRKSPGGSGGWAEDLSEAERQVRELEEEVRRFEEEMRKRRGGKGRKEAEEESALSKELGLEANPTRRQVAKARRAAAKLHHPDVQGGSAEKMSKINNILDRMEERARADSILSSLSARIYSGLTLNVDTSDACAQIRNDAMKGKKCPGGYSIPVNKQCGKGGKGGMMKSSGETNNANRWRLAGAVALGGLAMHQSGRIKQEKERRKNEMKEWDDLQEASEETLNSARELNRNKRRKDSVAKFFAAVVATGEK